MKRFDAHCHASYTNNLTRTGDADNLYDIEMNAGFSGACVQTIVMWYPDNILRNLLAIRLKAEYLGFFRVFGGIVFPQPGDPNPELAAQAARMIDAGFDGIKLFGKPTVRSLYDLPFTHAAYRELFAFCRERDVPILFHVGDPAEFWDPQRCSASAKAQGWYYGEGSFPALERLYDEVEAFLSDFPSLRIVFPHMLFLSEDLPRLDAMMARYPGMRTDVTPGIEMYHNMSRRREEARNFLVRRAGRVLLGTDNAGRAEEAADNKASCLRKVQNMRRFFETEDSFLWGKSGITGLDLPQDALAALYHGGFTSFLGESRPLAPDKVLRLCEEWRKKAKEGHAQNMEDYGEVMTAIQTSLANHI